MLSDVSNPDRVWLTRRERERLARLGVNPDTIETRDQYRQCVGREFSRAIESLNLDRAEALLELLEAGA